MLARIFQLSRSPTRSGRGKKKWCLSFTSQDKALDKVMGWVSSTNTMDEVQIFFDSEFAATQFAIKNHYQFEIIKHIQSKTVKKSYAENFI